MIFRLASLGGALECGEVNRFGVNVLRDGCAVFVLEYGRDRLSGMKNCDNQNRLLFVISV